VAINVIESFFSNFRLTAAAVCVDLRYGDPPVATADEPFPYQDTIAQISFDALINCQPGNSFWADSNILWLPLRVAESAAAMVRLVGSPTSWLKHTERKAFDWDDT
jgi:hypothetical protein